MHQPTRKQGTNWATFHDARDENNLAEWPLSVLSDSVAPGVKTIEFSDTVFDRQRGLSLRRRVCITGSDQYGLPTPKDEDLLLALIQLTRVANNFESPEVRFRKLEVIALLRWPRTGWAYDRVDESLHRWAGVTVHYFSAWRDHADKNWRDSTAMGVIQYVAIAGGRPATSDEGPQSVFTWNGAFFKSFRAGYLKKLDFSTYLALNRPAAKRAYRLLDKRFHFARTWELDLREFACEKIGLSRSYTTGQLKQRLSPALGELESVGFIEPVHYRKLAPKVWKVTITRRAATCPQNVRRDDKNDLAEALTQRGVSSHTARQLVAEYDSDAIRQQLSALAAQIRGGRRETIKNPAGYLVSAIRRGFRWERPAPHSEVRSSVRSSGRSVARTLPAPTSAASPATMAKEAWRCWWRSLPKCEQRATEARALARASRTHQQSYERLRHAGGPLLEELRDQLLAEFFAVGKHAFPMRSTKSRES